jgi:hypothetical protein
MQGSHESRGVWGEAQADAEGRFEFAGLDEGTANIFLMDNPNDGSWTYRAAADIALKTSRMTRVEIEPIRVLDVEGGVVEADSGSLVAGLPRGLHGPIWPRSGDFRRHDGRYHFRLPSRKPSFYLWGQAPAECAKHSIGRHPGR